MFTSADFMHNETCLFFLSLLENTWDLFTLSTTGELFILLDLGKDLFISDGMFHLLLYFFLFYYGTAYLAFIV